MTAPTPAAAVTNGRAVTTYASGMCQQYVRGQCWQVPALYASAIDAWNGARHRHPGDRNPPKGAPCYYAGGTFGHAVLSTGGGTVAIRSTDCPTAGRVDERPLSWPETSWGYTYLGWTEDINGVTLPGLTDEQDDAMPSPKDWTAADWEAFNTHVSNAVWNREQTVTHPDGTKDDRPMKQLLRETWQNVRKLV